MRELLLEEQVEHTNMTTAYEGLLADIISTVKTLKSNVAAGVGEI